jgi:hypothetical protein
MPSLNFAGLFGCVDFEMLFNVLVILGLIYLFFTPPVSGPPPSSFLHGLTTPTRLKTTPPRANHSTLWTLHFLVALSWTVRRLTPAVLAIPQRAQRSQAGLERLGPATVPSGQQPPLPPPHLYAILLSRYPQPRIHPIQPVQRRATVVQLNLQTPPRLWHKSNMRRPCPAQDPQRVWYKLLNLTPEESDRGGTWTPRLSTAIVSRSPHRFQYRPHVIKARRESLPSGSAQTSASSSSATAINSAGPSVAPNKPHNPEAVNTVANAHPKVGNGKGKEAFGAVTEHRQHTVPLPGRCLFLFSLSTLPHFLRSREACSKQESGGTNASDPRLQCGSSTATVDGQNEWANPTASSPSHYSAGIHPSTCDQHFVPCSPRLSDPCCRTHGRGSSSCDPSSCPAPSTGSTPDRPPKLGPTANSHCS